MNVAENVLVCSKLIALLLSHDINISTETAILCLDVIIFNKSLIKLILKKSDFVLIFLHLGSFWADSLEVLSLFCKLYKDLLVLILQYHKAPKYSSYFPVRYY